MIADLSSPAEHCMKPIVWEELSFSIGFRAARSQVMADIRIPLQSIISAYMPPARNSNAASPSWEPKESGTSNGFQHWYFLEIAPPAVLHHIVTCTHLSIHAVDIVLSCTSDCCIRPFSSEETLTVLLLLCSGPQGSLSQDCNGVPLAYVCVFRFRYRQGSPSLCTRCGCTGYHSLLTDC